MSGGRRCVGSGEIVTIRAQANCLQCDRTVAQNSDCEALRRKLVDLGWCHVAYHGWTCPDCCSHAGGVAYLKGKRSKGR